METEKRGPTKIAVQIYLFIHFIYLFILLICLNPYLPLIQMIAKANKFQQNPKMKDL